MLRPSTRGYGLFLEIFKQFRKTISFRLEQTFTGDFSSHEDLLKYLEDMKYEYIAPRNSFYLPSTI
eukprot:snap_masked-scaffold_9-processed-gene-1.4-mRNA-1 protein AED:1.00 eAED:1.00 QI:0/-1/0/0/-1/1/1/0/65